MDKLFIASFKQYIRDKEAIFWSLLFPIIFLLLFRLFDFSGTVNANVVIVDNANNQFSEILTKALLTVDGVGINTSIGSEGEAISSLEKAEDLTFEFLDGGSNELLESSGQINTVLVIPEGFGETAFNVQLYFDQANEGVASPSAILQTIIDDVTASFTGFESPYLIEREGISVNDIQYFDVLMPGILAMSIMQSGMIGISSTIATFKEKRILKRLSATPLPTWKFLSAEVLTHLVTIIIQIALLLIIGIIIFGAQVYGSIPLIVFVSFIGSFVFLNIGFLSAALTKSSQAAQSIASGLSTPMMFLSGVFFSREQLPEIVKIFADLLPLSPLIDALRDIALRERGLEDILFELALILVWTLATFLLAARFFKFREE